MIIMKSEMSTGIEFEHTLDGVLFEKYEDSLVGQYFVDLDYFNIMLPLSPRRRHA